MSGEAQSIDQFIERYPVDDRAREFLESSRPEVVQRVLRDFKPPREGERDYSGLLTSFVKRVRVSQGGGVQALEAGDFGPIRGGARAIEEFFLKYPCDDSAADFLASSPPDVQRRVLEEFRPPREGEGDYSALVTTFVKRCRGGVMDRPRGRQDFRRARSSSRSRSRRRPQRSRSRGRQGGRERHQDWQVSPGVGEVLVENFFARYPVDQQAVDLFVSLHPEAQVKVLSDFRPKREGERDYSGLFTSFAKRCSMDVDRRGGRSTSADALGAVALRAFFQRYPVDARALQEFRDSPPEAQKKVLCDFCPRQDGEADYSRLFSAFLRQRVPDASGGGRDARRHLPPLHARLLGGGASGVVGRTGIETEDEFFLRYPVDERALENWRSCGPELQVRIMADFRPRHEGEADYSSLLMAFIKRCRMEGGPDMSAGSASSVAFPSGTPEADFFGRYPVDDRALENFHSCDTELQNRIMTEFRAKREGEADYSSLLMAFIKRCRMDGATAMTLGGGGADASSGPWPSAMGSEAEFFLRYPVDERAMENWRSCGAELQARIMADFRPRHEGEADYSSLLMAFIKRSRMEGGFAGGGVAGTPSATLQEADFFGRYPVDDRAAGFLLGQPPDVRARVLADFRPPQEGEADYSRLLTAFVKRCGEARTGHGVSFAAPARGPSVGNVALEAFFRRYPVDDRAYEFFAKMPPAAQATIFADFRAKQEGEADYSSLFTSFAKRVRESTQGIVWTGSGTMGDLALEGFFRRYPIDDRAYSAFLSAPPPVQSKVLEEFRPNLEGEGDYSSRFTSFLTRVRNSVGGHAMSPMPVSGAPSPRDSRDAQGAFAAFFRRYPVDARAYDFFQNLLPSVKARVVADFVPMKEGERDYSGLFTSFVKKCINRASMSAGSLANPRGGSGASLPVSQVDGFFRRYPVDERAFDYFTQLAPELQSRVLAEFRPHREGERDYSGMLTAFVKRCLSSAAGNRGGDRNGGRSELPLRSGGGPGGRGQEDLDRFLQRYPIDDRALDFLCSQPARVITEVIREFAPRREGEGDYSAIVTTFTKRCRERLVPDADVGEADAKRRRTL